MRNAGTHQLVSKHSILSARRKNRDAAGAPRTRNHRLEAYGDRVGQIVATGESYCRHDANSTAPSAFKVYDRGRAKTEGANSRRRNREEEIERHWNKRKHGDTRCRIRRHHSPTRSERRDEIPDKMEEIAEILRSSMLFAKSSKPEEIRGTEELEKEQDEMSSSIPLDVIGKSEGAERNGDDQDSPLETPGVEAPATQERQ